MTTPAAAEPDPLAELEEAMRATPTITRPEDLQPDQVWQLPHVKQDRVPEVFLPLEAHILAGLAEAEGTPYTPAMLRMVRGATVPPEGDATYRIGLFEVLATEGGEPTGWLAAWDGSLGMYFTPPVDKQRACVLYDGYVESFTSGLEADAAFAAKPNECRACPDGCNDCTKDADCECYEHGTTYVDPPS